MSDEIEHIFDSILKQAEVYSVQKGDTLEKIVKNHPVAMKNGLLVGELADANPGLNPTQLQIGQKIVIPTGKSLQDIRKSREAPSAGPGALTAQIDKAFAEAAATHGVSEATLRGMAMVESNGNVCAQSGAGAQGLMQLMPVVQKIYGVSNPFDPISSIWGAAAHLANMMKSAKQLVKYMPQADVEKVALTMYNMGEAAYRGAVRSGRPLPKEASEYANKVRAAAGSRPTYKCNRDLV